MARMQEANAAITADNYAPYILGGMLAMQIKAQLNTESSHQYGNGIEANDDPSRSEMILASPNQRRNRSHERLNPPSRRT